MKQHFYTPLLMALLCLFSLEEMQSQIAVCQPNITKNTPPSGCMATLSFSDIDAGSSDYDTYSLSETQFIGPDTFQVVLTVMKNSGQSHSCTSTLYVLDNTNPVPVVKNDLFIRMDSTNMADLTPEMFDLGSYDYCSGITNQTVSPSTVSCTDVSPVQVVFTVYDGSGNSAQASVNVRLSNASNNTLTLACNDMVTVKLNPGESKKMYPYEILEGGPYKCWENYSLDILENNIPFPDDVVRYEDVNKNLIVKITDNATQIACWGSLMVKAEICDALIICDTKSRCDSIGDCSGGHSLDDDVEWPCDLILIEVSPEVYQNPTPEMLAEFTQKDLDEYIPILYNDNSLCSNDVAIDYEDVVFLDQPGKTIHRTWRLLHWQTNATYAYLQVIRLGESGGVNCDICDSLAWDTPFNGCDNGHSDLDAVEWPADISIDGLRISPTDLWYEDSFNKSNAMPWIRENCKYLIEIVFEDSYQQTSPDTLQIERVWKIFHKFNQKLYTYTQNIVATNIPNSDAKVCVRRANGDAMNDVDIFPDVNMEIGPCTEFVLQPNHTILKPAKPDTDYMAGVDLTDLIMMHEHILGISQLDARQQAAGDWNGNSALTTLDLLFITKMIEGDVIDLSLWPSPWKFAYHYLNFNSGQSIVNQVNVFPGSHQNTGHHFVAYKFGDVNDSYQEIPMFSIPVNVKDNIITKGEKYTISILATSDLSAKGIQFKIKNTDGIEINTIENSTFSFKQMSPKSEYTSFFAYNDMGMSTADIKKGDVLFTVEFEATKNDVLHNVLQFLEGDHQKIITDDYRSIPFDIHFDGLITVGTKNQNLVNVQVQPNPVHDILTIIHDFNGPITATVFSSTGQKMMCTTLSEQNTLSLDSLSPAMYFLQIMDANGKTGYTSFIKN